MSAVLPALWVIAVLMMSPMLPVLPMIAGRAVILVPSMMA